MILYNYNDYKQQKFIRQRIYNILNYKQSHPHAQIIMMISLFILYKQIIFNNDINTISLSIEVLERLIKVFKLYKKEKAHQPGEEKVEKVEDDEENNDQFNDIKNKPIDLYVTNCIYFINNYLLMNYMNQIYI